MKCFYCGRVMSEERDETGRVLLRCTYPRCKLKPESDWEDSLEEAMEDILLIKESLKN